MVLWLLSVAVLAQDAPVWTPFAKLQESRANACAVRLAEPGRVLISGGAGSGGAALASVEILSASGVPQYAAPLHHPRSGHTCTLLRDGRVLVTGGAFQGSNAEVYDPANDFWLPVPSAGPSRTGSTATMLLDGRVLIAGGYTGDGTLLPYVEIFDPSSNRFSGSTGQMNNPRRDHAAAMLPDGKVAISGGTGIDGAALRSVEYFDPVTSIIWTGPDLVAARRGHTAVSLEDGRVLVLGGVAGSNTAETLDPLGQRWTTLAARPNAAGPRAVFVIPGNGRVLVAGGPGGVEVFDPAANRFEALAGTQPEDLAGSAIAPSDDGTVLLVGGTTVGNNAQDAVYRLTFPALSFSAGVYHPGEMVRVSGRHLPPNAAVQLQMDFVRGTAANQSLSVTPQFRILTPRATTDDTGAFAQVPMLEPFAADTGARLRLTATSAVPNGPRLVREIPIKYASEMIFGIPPSTVEGQNVALNVSIAPVEGAPRPTGPITATFGPQTMVNALNSATSTAAYPSAKLPTGALGVTAVYPGDAYYDFVARRTTLGVASRTPVIDLVPSTLTPQIGVAFQVYAQIRVESSSVVAGGPAPTGKVLFYESGVPIGEGKVVWTTTYPVPQMMTMVEYTASKFGPQLSFTAQYLGDENYGRSSSAAVVATVQRAQPNLTLNAIPSIFNLTPLTGPPIRFHCDVPVPFHVVMAYPPLLQEVGATPFTVLATTSAGATIPVHAGRLEIPKAGTASKVIEATLPNDTIRVQANFAGDFFLRPAVSAFLPMAIIPVPVQVRVAASEVNPETDALILSATVVNDAGPGCRIAGPTGSVEFVLGGRSLGLIPLNNTGAATLRILRPLDVGPVTIFARYVGDPLHTPSDSLPITVTFNLPPPPPPE